MGVPMGTLWAPFSALFRKKMHLWCPCWSPWGITLEGWELGPLFSQKVLFYLSKTTTFRRSPGSIFSPCWEQFGPSSALFGSVFPGTTFSGLWTSLVGGQKTLEKRVPRVIPKNEVGGRGATPLIVLKGSCSWLVSVVLPGGADLDTQRCGSFMEPRPDLRRLRRVPAAGV